MGLTYVTVTVLPLAGSRKKKLEESFLVDTGAVDCLAAASKLRKIGVKAEGKDVYERQTEPRWSSPTGLSA